MKPKFHGGSTSGLFATRMPKGRTMKASLALSRLVSIESAGTATVVRFQTQSLVGDEAGEAVCQKLLELVDQGRIRLLLDVKPLEYLDSAVVAGLIVLRKRIIAAGGRLAMLNMSPLLREKIFNVLRLTPLFPEYASEDDAILRMEEGDTETGSTVNR